MSEALEPLPRREALDPEHRLVRLLYNLMLAGLLPVLAVYYAYRVTLGGKSRQGFAQRLGFLPRGLREGFDRKEGAPLVWVHAVSVGEVAVAETIVEHLLARRPDLIIALSVTTATGSELAHSRLGERCRIFYLPLDLPLCVGQALDALRPDALVLMETELWPNLLDRAHARGVRTMVVNGRVSDRSFRRAWLSRLLYGWVLRCVDDLCMQSQQDAERIVHLGADPGRVRVLGHSKFDESYPEMPSSEREALRAEYGIAADAPVLIYGSTGPGENGLLLDAFLELRCSRPDLRLIHVPRHPERAGEIEALARERGFEVVRRTSMREGVDSPIGKDCVIVIDTIGELVPLYAISDVAFVGRSLVPQGGGNILQPLAYGSPVLVGPYAANFKETVDTAKRAGVCFEVADAAALAREVLRLLDSPDLRAEIANRAHALFEENRGAAGRYADAVLASLGWQATCA